MSLFGGKEIAALQKEVAALHAELETTRGELATARSSRDDALRRAQALESRLFAEEAKVQTTAARLARLSAGKRAAPQRRSVEPVEHEDIRRNDGVLCVELT